MLGNYRRAVKSLEAGIEMYPHFQEALFYLGKMHLKLKEYDKAANDFRSCLEHNDEHELAYIFLGDTYRLMGKEEIALESYNKAVEKGKHHSSLATTKKIQLLIDF